MKWVRLKKRWSQKKGEYSEKKNWMIKYKKKILQAFHKMSIWEWSDSKILQVKLSTSLWKKTRKPKIFHKAYKFLKTLKFKSSSKSKSSLKSKKLHKIENGKLPKHLKDLEIGKL